MTQLKDKVILITGSSKGLGKSLALACAKAGAKVVLNGRNKVSLYETAKEFEEQSLLCLPIQADCSDPHQVQQMIDTTISAYKTIDILINNAATRTQKDIESITVQEIEKEINNVLTTQIFCTKFALPYIKEQKGSIIFISSTAGLETSPETIIYGTAKTALNGFHQALKKQYEAGGIHTGIIYPGNIKEEKAEGSVTQAQVTKAILSMIENRQSKKKITPLNSNRVKIVLRKIHVSLNLFSQFTKTIKRSILSYFH